MRDMIHLAVRLLAFCLVAGLLLAVTNAVTKGPIAEQAALIAQNARKKVMTEASGFELIASGPTEKYPHLSAVYEGRDSGGVVGYTFSLTPMGFKASIEMTLGIRKDGAITALSVDSQQETAGLGTKITADSYLQQFPGLAADSSTLEDEIDGITGATVTSRAVEEAVKEAVLFAENELGIVGQADETLAGSRLLDEDELRLVSLIDGGSVIASLSLYEAMGYDLLKDVYQVSVRGKHAYVLTMEQEGTVYEIAIDENARMTLYLGDEPVQGCENLDASEAIPTDMDGQLRQMLVQAKRFYNLYLADKEG